MTHPITGRRISREKYDEQEAHISSHLARLREEEEASADLRGATLSLLRKITAGELTGNPYACREVRAAIRAVGSRNGYDLPKE